jgi:ABC-type glycerol-3-phosphate transport system permease component
VPVWTLHDKIGPLRQKAGENLAPLLLKLQETCHPGAAMLAPKLRRKGAFFVKTAITIIADLLRSLVISGVATASVLLLIVAASAMAGYGLWRLWLRTRR